MLTAEQILAADDLKTEVVPVPEWGGDVLVRTLTGTLRDAFESAIFNTPKDQPVNRDNIRARLCAAALVDGAGNLLFQPNQVTALGRKSAIALDRVYAVAQRLAGLTKADVDDLEKNSGGGPSDGSGSN